MIGNVVYDDESIKKIVEKEGNRDIDGFKSHLICLSPNNIRLISNPKEYHYIEAIMNDPRRDKIFKYNIPPEKQTENICIAAMKRSGLALCRVVNQTENICLEAVKQNGAAIKYVKNPTKEICLEAVKQNPHALKYIKNIDEELYLESVKSVILSLSYLINNDSDIKQLEGKIIDIISSIQNHEY